MVETIIKLVYLIMQTRIFDIQCTKKIENGALKYIQMLISKISNVIVL